MDQDLVWWRGSVIYQVYVRSFYDADGDGIGDLPGVIAKLDYIASLGIDAIWLCPFYTSPQRDFGYDVSDHLSVDPVFGTLHDFDMLVARAHELDVKVIIDQVWGHTSVQHPWFMQSRDDQSNAKADWYVWADPRPDGTPPNNWLAVFGGSAWTWEPRRRQFYLHHFLAEQPNLNFANPDVLDAILNTGRFWLDRGVDGFRLDAIDFMMHDPLLRDNPPNRPDGGIVPAKLFALQQHVWDVLRPERFQIFRAVRRLMEQYPGTATIGEVSSQPGAFERVIEYTRGDDLLHMAYTSNHLREGFTWDGVRRMLRLAEEAGDSGHVCWNFSNHDTARAISRLKPEGADDQKFAIMLLHLLLALPGSVCIYQGEELGLDEAHLRFEELRDPFGIAYWPEFKGRDGSRTPIPWTDEAVEKTWLPIPFKHLPLAVARQEGDAAALLHVWRKAIAFRNNHAALRYGQMKFLDLPYPFVGFIRHVSGEDAMLCLFNVSGEDGFINTEFFTGAVNGFAYALRPLESNSALTLVAGRPIFPLVH
jgi:alpha-glucosidase